MFREIPRRLYCERHGGRVVFGEGQPTDVAGRASLIVGTELPDRSCTE